MLSHENERVIGMTPASQEAAQSGITGGAVEGDYGVGGSISNGRVCDGGTGGNVGETMSLPRHDSGSLRVDSGTGQGFFPGEF